VRLHRFRPITAIATATAISRITGREEYVRKTRLSASTSKIWLLRVCKANYVRAPNGEKETLNRIGEAYPKQKVMSGVQFWVQSRLPVFFLALVQRVRFGFVLAEHEMSGWPVRISQFTRNSIRFSYWTLSFASGRNGHRLV